MFYAAPVWIKCANTHIHKIQILQNKVLKLILNKPKHFSTTRVHVIEKIELVPQKLQKITNNSNLRCCSSEFEHINELVS